MKRKSKLSNKIIVADTGPLIAFVRLEKLDLLAKVFSKVMVTRTVLEECVGRPDLPEVPFIQNAIDRKILQVIESADFSGLMGEIDDGEASAISTAISLRCGVLLDDKKGRRVARHLNVPIIGTVGVLVLAKHKRLITRVKPLLDALVRSGYFLGEDLIAAALETCNER